MSSLSFVGPNGRFEVPVRVVLRYRSIGGVANAVAAGIGLASIPALMFEDPHFKRVLIPALTEQKLRDLTMYFLYVSHNMCRSRYARSLISLWNPHRGFPCPILSRLTPRQALKSQSIDDSNGGLVSVRQQSLVRISWRPAFDPV